MIRVPQPSTRAVLAVEANLRIALRLHVNDRS